MRGSKQQFGGRWTEEKLERVRKYLVAYATIMRKFKFKFAYIDAFAGTGYNAIEADDQEAALFPEFNQEEKAFLDGSARIALKVEPRFNKYIFIEKSEERVRELEKLKNEFPDKAADMSVVHEDANAHIQKLCRSPGWDTRRAVIFLDPFGMHVSWETMEAIAKTKAIDLWILFPLGVGVNRLLRRDAKISRAWREKLDDFFGTPDWFDAFYATRENHDLFGKSTKIEKTSNFDQISAFFVKRLKSIFPGVAEKPLELKNSVGNPLFLLCFAAGNEKGAKTAVKIAGDILKR